MEMVSNFLSVLLFWSSLCGILVYRHYIPSRKNLVKYFGSFTGTHNDFASFYPARQVSSFTLGLKPPCLRMLHNVNQDFHHKTNNKQDGKCTYNVTSRGIRATIVVMERQWVLYSLIVCICSRRYPEPMSMRLIVIWGLSRSREYFHMIS